jgi:hypothetical protein
MGQTATVTEDGVNARDCEHISQRFAEFLVSPYRQARKQFGTAKNIGWLRVIVVNTIVGNTTYKTGSSVKMFSAISELGIENDSDLKKSKDVWQPLFHEALSAFVRNGGKLNEWANVIVNVYCVEASHSHRFGSGQTDVDLHDWRS